MRLEASVTYNPRENRFMIDKDFFEIIAEADEEQRKLAKERFQ